LIGLALPLGPVDMRGLGSYAVGLAVDEIV